MAGRRPGSKTSRQPHANPNSRPRKLCCQSTRTAAPLGAVPEAELRRGTSNVSSHWAICEPPALIPELYWPEALFSNVSLAQPMAERPSGPPPVLAPPLGTAYGKEAFRPAPSPGSAPWDSLWQRGPQACPQSWLRPSTFINSWHSLKENSPGCSLVGLMLKLKLWPPDAKS